jgi:hypothetical protein
MSHRHHDRRRRRHLRKQGFSRSVSRQWYDMLGIPREQKRGFFNMLSKNVVGAFAVTAGLLGLIELGWLGGILLAACGAVFGLWFVTQDRMFR